MATLNCPKSSHFLKSGGLLRAMNEMVYLAPDVFRFPCFIVPDLQTTCGVEWLIHPEFQNITTNIKYPRFLNIRIFCVLSEQKLMRSYVRTIIGATIFVTSQMPTFSLEKNVSARRKVFDVMWRGTRRESVFVRQCLENLVTVLSNT